MSINNFFNYKVIDGDPTCQRITQEENFYGFNESKPLIYDKEYLKLHDDIVNDKKLMSDKNRMGYGATIDEVKKSIAFWDSVGIKLHDVDILDLSFKISDGKFTVTQKFLDSIYTSHPSEIPVVFGQRKKQGPKFGVDLLEMGLTKDDSVLYRKILLPRYSNEVTSSIYNHEISHTQLSTMVGSCTNILNTETIPIFIELIYASMINDKTFEIMLNNRLINIARDIETLIEIENIAFVSRIEIDTYLKSSIQAIALANLYLNGGSELKKEIINFIDQIFWGNRSVEEMLNRFEANLEEVSKDIKSLKKV